MILFIVKIINIPAEWKKYAMIINFVIDIFLITASIVIPISVGSGDAIKNPANTGNMCYNNVQKMFFLFFYSFYYFFFF